MTIRKFRKMNKYKHYSFDLWLTLIKSNPAFKIERAKFFHKNLNTKKKSIEIVSSIFRQVDLMCNSINEKTGKNIDSDEMYLMVISIINDFEKPFIDLSLDWLYEEMELLNFSYMPVVYSNDTLDVLNKLKQQNNTTFNISSNTAFIKGKTIRTILSELSLFPFFDFHIYSDEINFSKPDKRFFEIMLSSVRNIDCNKDILLNEIIHVGDNPIADVEGALSVGINTILINSNNSTILDLLK